MKTIGFIDYFIDEWHANIYPREIRASRYQRQFEVTQAWAEFTPAGKKSIDEWCREQQVQQATSIEELVANCDCIVVLSPDNAERHEDLADIALRSGKPVYLDKPIAPSLAAAQRLFVKAENFGTPLMSSSALRYSSAFVRALAGINGQRVSYCATRGSAGPFDIYAIHQIEMLVLALGTGATRVMQCGNAAVKHVVVDYSDGRRGTFTLQPGYDFQLGAVYGDGQHVVINEMNDFIPPFIDAMLTFFDTGVSLIPPAETLEVAALIEATSAALEQMDTWVPVPER